MKLQIMHKLFILVSLPIITLIIYSVTHINKKYLELEQSQLNISKLDVMKLTSSLLHELQVERGSGLSILHKVDNDYFIPIYKQQQIKTNQIKTTLQSRLDIISSKNISYTSKKYIKSFQNSWSTIQEIRKSVEDSSRHPQDVYKYYTLLNTQLLSLYNSLELATDSIKASTEITTLSSLLKLQEYAGRERVLVSKISAANVITNEEMHQYHNLLSSQEIETNTILFLLEDHSAASILYNLNLNYKDSSFTITRKEILNHEEERLLLNQIRKIIWLGGLLNNIHQYNQNQDQKTYQKILTQKTLLDTLIKKYLNLSSKLDKEKSTVLALQNAFNELKPNQVNALNDVHIAEFVNILDTHHVVINPQEWFHISSQRINLMHQTEEVLYKSILESINTNIAQNNALLKKQVLITLLTILLLLAGTFYIANKIRSSIASLEKGMNVFFEFLNGKTDKPNEIIINSNDEINSMADTINLEIKTIQANLDEDRDFLEETTHIVKLMQNGDFSEKSYFEPHSPLLIEFNSVFNQLIELIQEKIKEQTNSLEDLNSSLEERVHYQTLELEKQIEEITIAMDKAIKAEIAKDEFLANMSHEIRTPLNAILGFVTILKKQTKEEQPLKYLNIIDTSGKSLLTIINDILDFSKIKSGKFVIAPHASNLLEELSVASLLFASKAYDKHISYTVYIDPNLPKKVNVDTVRVKQILSNVLSNAIKFTPDDGNILLNITVENSRLILSVQDTGIGIEKEHLSKIFSAFEQADGSTTRKYGGTGLGLSISHKLAELMDGELTVESQKDIGSTFTLNIPVKIIEEEPQVLIEPSKLAKTKIAILGPKSKSFKLPVIKQYLNDFGASHIIELQEYQENGYDLLFFVPDDAYNEYIVTATKPAIAVLKNASIKLASLDHIQALYLPCTPASIIQAINDSGIDKLIQRKQETIQKKDEVQFIGSILVVEDNKTNQMLISLILDDYGLDFDIANDGVEGVSMFKEGNYDLVLMDENMPELNGIGAMKQIKEYEQKKQLIFTPILALTASVLESDKKMFIDAGMDGFVGKPIETDELESELSRFLKKKSA